MPEQTEFVTVRRLPDGGAQTARIANRAPDRLALEPVDNEPDLGFEPGVLVQIDSPAAMYLGEVVGPPKNSLLTVAVEHFIDRSALAEIQKVWKTPEEA
jgi:hypothetical protein